MKTLSLSPAKDSDRDWVWETKKRCFSGYVKQAYGVWDDESQTSRFHATYDPQEVWILKLSESVIGYVSYACNDEEFRLFNIMILPEFQNRGLGSAVIRKCLKEAGSKGVPLRLQVLKVNPARRLYERLGLTVTGQDEVHYQMQCDTNE